MSSEYIKCPECRNCLGLDFIGIQCPNPLCGFNFDGLQGFIDEGKDRLLEMAKERKFSVESTDYKLLGLALRYYMYDYLVDYVKCTWGAHYQTIYKQIIHRYLDDPEIVKKLLLSDVIKSKNIKESKSGCKIFWELYKSLYGVQSSEVKVFLVKEFPVFYRKLKIQKSFDSTRQRLLL
jgi:hypothetical protein